VQAPSISTLSTNTGAVGAPVTITGTSFGTSQGPGTVTFNGTAANVTSWASTSIAVTVPNAATTGNVVVNTAGVASNGMSFTVVPTPNITNLSLTSGPIGSPITITGTNFGSTQGTVSFNGIGATPTSWSATSIGVTVPGGATTGNVVVNAGGVASNGINFIVSTLPSGWLDQDIGSVGTPGTANYSSGAFIVQGAGGGFVAGTTADALHFAYRTMTGDGTIVARIANISGGQAAVMVRETLNPNSTTMSPGNWAGNSLFYRTTTGSAMASVNASGNFPYWFKVTRSGNIFTAYIAPDGVNWVKVSTSQTINMAQTIYVGLGAASGNGDLSTVTFDGVSLNSTANPAPAITSVSATSGSIGSQVIVTGQNFGALQGNSSVLLNGVATTINSWSNTSITSTIPTGSASGYLVVSVAPSMNDSNPVEFTVTTNPLPSGWLDQDIGYDGQPGSSTYSNGVFTIVGGGNSPENAVHFDYRVLSGDGTIIARVASVSNNGWGGVMMRDGLNSGDSSIFLCGCNGANLLWSRSVSGGSLTQISGQQGGLPYWVKLVRTGTDFVGYISADGVSWTPVGGSVPISMSQSIYVGLWGTGNGGTVTFDDVSLSTQANPAPVISSLSATTGPVGTQVIISGSGFGASQGSSIATLNDLPVTIGLWSDTSIAVTIPSGTTSGYIVVVRGPSMDSSNPESFYVTSSPLPSGWFDLDIGANRLFKAGSATYSSGVFTVNGSSLATGGSGDGLHFVYQPITADFTIIARITSLNQFARAGVMIRQTLDSNSPDAVIYSNPSGNAFLAEFDYRTSYGGPLAALSLGTGSLGWVKLIRAADTFTAFYSPDGINWTQVGTTQTIQSTQAVYAGIATTTGGGTGLGTATIDNVSITLGGTLPNPLITGLSRMSGAPGSLVTISGSGFGATQGTSTTNFNGVASSTVYSWSDTQIQAAVPDGATTGPVSVVVGNITGSGPNFTVTFAATVTDSLGNQTAYNSSLFGGQWAFTSAQGSGCSSCTVRGTTQSQYDSQGRLVWTIDALGHGVVYRYDSFNNLISQQVEGDSNTPSATTTYTNYNSLGEPQTVTDPLGQVTGKVTTNTYDIHGNLTSVRTPAPNGSTSGSLTQFGYNPLGQLVTITDPLNNATALTYTPAGLIATITDMQSNVTTYAYDLRGNRTSVMDALHHQTTFEYDLGDRLKKINYPDTTTTTFEYDYRGRRTSVTDQNFKTTIYGYDDADRLISVSDAAIPQNVTNYVYDTENNLTSITDANHNQTVFDYDEFGRVKQTNFPSSQIETFRYDANNNLISKTDRKNQTIQYVYDVLNRLTRKIYQDSSEADYVYDLVGKVQNVNDPTGTYAFAYDNMGRLIGTTTNYNFLMGKTFTNSYAYDAASNRTGFTDPETGSTTYAYDTLNRLQTLTPPAAISGGSFGFSYDALSRRTQMTRPNSVTTNYGYDNLSHLLSVLHQVSGSTIDGASYTVDSAGNRTVKTDQRLALTTNYGYDPIYQLLSATQSGSTTENYTYDPVGNRLSSVGVASYNNNTSNELTATSNASYGYDLNGNAATKNNSAGITTYAWDFENRLTSVTLPASGGTVSFKYDPFGRRIYKSSSTATSVYAYDGDNLIEETNASGAAVARYSQGLNIDEPLAMLRSATTSYYNADGLGSITSLANSAGALAQNYTFDSFGKLTASSGSLTNPFQYTAREFDSETGLYYYRARYYDPSAGRFMSEDPTGFKGGVNFYPYVTNDPTDQTDPMGFDSDSQFCRRLREKIDHVRQNIQRRIGQLDENPDNLRETCPGDKANPGLSRAGHRFLINKDKALLAALEATYAWRCKDWPKIPPIPVPVLSPQQQRQLATNTAVTVVVGIGVVVVVIALSPVGL
jgi:RHS repeat-associated protein